LSTPSRHPHHHDRSITSGQATLTMSTSTPAANQDTSYHAGSAVIGSGDNCEQYCRIGIDRQQQNASTPVTSAKVGRIIKMSCYLYRRCRGGD
jgi:hypothetical protein